MRYLVNRTRILGAYLMAAGIVQTTVYVGLSTSRGPDWLFYFDPRIGIFFLETGWRGAEEITPGILRWLSVVWILTLGMLFLCGRQLVKTYIVSEVALALPNIFFLVTIIGANLTPAHGFSVGELFLPMLEMIAFSVLPVTLAFWSLRRKAHVESPNAERA